MQRNHHDPTDSASARIQHIADMHRAHARQLERRVARHARADPQTIEDACSFAWLQLLTHTKVDLGPPSCRALAWLTLIATREAGRVRDGLLDCASDERERGLRGLADPAVDELAASTPGLNLSHRPRSARAAFSRG